MSRCEDFDNSFWDDDVLERLTAYPTLLYIWSWTNPRCGMAGLYKVRRSTMTESKVPAEDIPAALDALAAENLAHHIDGWLWVVARTKRLRTKTPQMAKSVVKDLRQVPSSHRLLGMWLDRYRGAGWLHDHLLEARDVRFLEPIGTYPENGSTKGNAGNLLEVPLTGTAVSSSSSKSEAEGKTARPEILELSVLLASLIRSRDPKAKVNPTGKGWTDAVRLLVDADGRDPHEVERIIRWCQADGFWQRNILSAPKLREKFTQLVAAAGQQGPGLRPVVGGKYDAAAAAKANRGEAA